MRALIAIVILVFVSLVSSVGLTQKVNKLNGLAKESPLIPYQKELHPYILEGPRNFSIVMIFNSFGEKFSCIGCSELHNELETAAYSWALLNIPSTLYFIEVDYSVNPEVFREMDIQNVPVMIYLNPNDQKKINIIGHDADDVLSFVEKKLSIVIPLNTKPDPEKMKRIYYGSGIAFLALLIFHRFILRIIRSPFIWATTSMIFCLFMISGQMWNRLRSAPYSKGTTWLSQSFQSQYIFETQVIFCLYFLASMSFLLLVIVVPKISNVWIKRFCLYIIAALFLGFLTGIALVFKYKSGSYSYGYLLTILDPKYFPQNPREAFNLVKPILDKLPFKIL